MPINIGWKRNMENKLRDFFLKKKTTAEEHNVRNNPFL